MRRHLPLLLLLFFLSAIAIQAQVSFTQHVRSRSTGEGKVVIVQDSLIDHVVNNTKPATNTKQATPHKDMPPHEDMTRKSPAQDHDDTDKEGHIATHHSEPSAHIARQRYRATGYRIQIYTGSNSHKDKAAAYAIGAACQRAFPMLSVYPRFISPRWVCRVGDFRSHEDAQAYVRKIRAARISKEVRIVRCEVLLAR